MNRIYLIGIIYLLLLGCKAQNNNHTDLSIQLDSLLTEVYLPNEPGASVLVYNKGDILLQKGYGLANYDTKEPVTPDHVFCIGSITKQFTAMAILMLEEQGKLSISDPIHKYLPDYPHSNKKITIENVLTHTAGLVDVFEVTQWFETWNKELSPQEFVDIFKNEPLLSEPGTTYHYSNFGYAILGLIIEKLSGKTYSEFISENIFKPLEMNNSYILKTNDINPKATIGYNKTNDEIIKSPTINYSHLYAAGSICSCPADMLKWYLWLSELYRGNDLKITKMLTKYSFADGTLSNNGFGMMLYILHDYPAAGNNGGMLGFTNYTLWLYKDDIIVILLSNNRYEDTDPLLEAKYDVTANAKKLSEIVLGIKTEQVNYITLSESDLDKYTGMFKIEKNVYRIITRKGNQLYSKRSNSGQRKPINPTSLTEFLNPDGSKFEFVFDKTGTVIQANWRKPDGTLSIAERTDLPIPEDKKPAIISDKDYEAICGLYKFMVVFDVKIYRSDSSSIIVESKQRGKSVFFPESSTRFFFADDENTVIDFIKNKKGIVEELKMTSEGRTFSAKKNK